MKVPIVLVGGAFAISLGGLRCSAEPPRPVSPGRVDGVARAGERCPTFSWGATPRAVALHLVVYDASEERTEPQLVVREELPASVSSWTPPLEHCLLPGRLYAWRIGAVDRAGGVAWSEPAWFEVEPVQLGVPEGWVEEVIERLKEGGRGETPSAVPVGTTRRDPQEPLASPAEARMARAASFFSVGSGGAVSAGAVTAESFAGDGSAVTNVDALTLQGNAAAAFALSAHAHDDRYYTETELAASGGGGDVHWDNVASVPGDLADGDDDTTYTAGPGLALSGTTFSLGAFGGAPAAHTTATLDTGPGMGVHTSITIGADGLGLISYVAEPYLKVAHCDDVPCTSATVSLLTGGDAYTSVAIGPDGLGVVGFVDGNDFKVARCADTSCTSATVTTVTGIDCESGTLAIGSDGLPLIATYDYSSHDLKVAHCTNAACSAALVTTLATTGDVGQYPALAVGAYGYGEISYYDGNGNDFMMVHCRDVACTLAGLDVLDDAMNPGQHSSIAIGSDGLPIAVYSSGSGAIYVAHKESRSSNAVTVSYFDCGSAECGQYPSVAVGSDGLPVISYYDVTNGDLKVAHCGTPTCASASVATLDSAGDVGRYTSITLGADGLPLISYYDATNHGLKVAHCANAFCAPYFRRR